MRYEVTDHEWAAIKPMLPKQAARGPTCERPPCPEWHLLGLTVWRGWHVPRYGIAASAIVPEHSSWNCIEGVLRQGNRKQHHEKQKPNRMGNSRQMRNACRGSI